MSWDSAKCIDYYYGEYKKGGILGKKHNIKFGIYPSEFEGIGFDYYGYELSNDTNPFEIPFDAVKDIRIDKIGKEQALIIDYNPGSVVANKISSVALLGMADVNKWFATAKDTKARYNEEKQRKQQLELQKREEKIKLEAEREEQALVFYNDCYSFHIKETTPVYQLFADKNKIALIYIGEDKSLNFLKIDGYAQEENNGVIAYRNIHYYEKAGNVSYTTDIHGNYSSYGGSMTGGKFSKLATVGGGLLFGYMGMAIGAALTYKPAEQKPVNTSFSIDSDIRKIDDRSVILNFYSDAKRQYIDIELPQDIYNFLQTYLPEKKYGIVDELEKKTVVHQSADIISEGSLLKVGVKPEVPTIESQEKSMEEFKIKIEKLKMMKEAGLLSDEKFAEEQAKLLSMI